MKKLSFYRPISLTLALFSLVIFHTAPAAETPAKDSGNAVTVTPLPGKVRVEIGGKLFTEYIYQDTPKPFLYPVIGPGELPLTRNFPMKKDVAGEDTDHPHHRSLWFCHGDVNGVNFWAENPPFGRIVQTKMEQAAVVGGRGVIRSADKWVDPAGKVVLTDRRVTSFLTLPGGGRAIDFEITLLASEGDVTFTDTKEGSMAIRTHAALSLRDSKGKPRAGQAVNSNDVSGVAVWGKHADWVDYWGKINGNTVGVAVFDHPANPHHPTTWHARDYGLIAANPFGLHDFEGKPAGSGNLVIRKGGEVTFRYRFLFHEGDAKQAKIAEAYQAYATTAQ